MLLLFSSHLFLQFPWYGHVLPMDRFNLTAQRTVGKMAKTRDEPPNKSSEITEAVFVLETKRTYSYFFHDIY